MDNKKPYMQLNEKYALTIHEAALYFGIGETRIRQLCAEQPNSNFILKVNTKTLIKRKLFEHYLDKTFTL